MKVAKLCFLTLITFIIILDISEAAVPVIEFNMSNDQREGVIQSLPHRYIPIKNAFVWTENQTTYFNITKLVELPENEEFVLSSNNPQNIIISIDQEKKIVGATPKQGWYGEETVIIYIDGIGSEAIKDIKIISNDLLIENIDFDELKTVFLDDTLYNIFSTRMNNVFKGRIDYNQDIDIDGRLDREKDTLTIDVGKDLDIITTFYEEEGINKPSVKIIIDANLVDYNDEIAHCQDGIRNYDELNADCGGECIKCTSTNYNRQIITGLIVISLISLIGFIALRYEKRDIRKKTRNVKIKPDMNALRKATIEQIKSLRTRLDDVNSKKNMVVLSGLVRKYFAILLHIKYKFTYNELEKELFNRKIIRSEKVRLLKLFKKISMAEYGDYKLNKDKMIEIVDEAVEIITRLELRE